MRGRALLRSAHLLLSAILLVACAVHPVAPLTDPGSLYAIDEDEQRLIREAKHMDAEFRRRGLVFVDSDLQQYIDGVALRLLPALLPEELEFHFGVLREPTINAFAMANGGIYLHTGLLARLENEAQLAHVLAHEITHVILRHGVNYLKDFKRKTVAAKVASTLLVPAGAAVGAGGLAALIVGVSHAAAVNGYGRDMEREADLEGLRHIAAAGYKVREAQRLFSLLNEVEEPGAATNFFWGNHPLTTERAQYTRELIETGQVQPNPNEISGAEDFRFVVHGAVLENIRLRIRARHYQFALQELAAALERYGESAELYYYRGEVHRRAAEDPEGAAREEAFRRRKPLDQHRVKELEEQAPEKLSAAIDAYRQALKLNPKLSSAHRGLGLVAYEQEDTETARTELEAYLTGRSKVMDRRFVERILREISR